MQDDRWQSDDDEANTNDRRAAFIDRTPRAGAVRPAAKQPDHRGPPTPEEIQAFIKEQYGDAEATKKKLIRPPGWDGEEKPVEPEGDPAERFER